MNAKLLREIAQRHAPDEVKEVLLKLNKLEAQQGELKNAQRELEFEALHGKPATHDGCERCGHVLHPRPGNGHALSPVADQ